MYKIVNNLDEIDLGKIHAHKCGNFMQYSERLEWTKYSFASPSNPKWQQQKINATIVFIMF